MNKPTPTLTTVHKDVTSRLRHIDCDLYDKVRAILNQNKAERHIRGGMATKRKYEARES
ncbi:MAG: sporulation transcriptional regulator SpoIIID [Clostridia bacterium]|nr:sporulation transcriptional regulator SpoIIID [Clostridia bacterium]MBO5408804.1 sporulation transcriptional regulator SpoIIID [Clostridia bacterium]